ncbi:MAG: HAMP domain-containing sensor histidine kinase [Nocardioides sp.]
MSLRTRASLLGALVFAVLLTGGAVLLVSTLESRLTEASDQLSRTRVDDLLALARAGDLPEVLRNVGDNGVAQVVAEDGTVLASSPNIAGAGPVADLRPGASAETKTFSAPDDDETETYRFWYASGPGADGPVTAYVGDSLESVSEASATLRHALWVGIPAVVLLLATVMWTLIGRVIGRLDRIRLEVDRISDENLHARVAGDGVDDEVGRLAATMNAMLERLDVAARRQRDLVADVSHDLQSPLTAQRVALELALSRPDQVDAGRLRDEVLGATAQMEKLVGNLLVVASLDARVEVRPSLIDLDGLVLEEAARARSGGAEIDTSAVSGAPAYANADDVRRVVRNLLDNAVVHARARVALTVDLVAGETGEGSRGSWAQLLVADDGPGIAPEHRERIFERFYRADPARSHDDGSGLGLSIARALAERNGGRLALVDAAGGTTMRLWLPTAG